MKINFSFVPKNDKGEPNMLANIPETIGVALMSPKVTDGDIVKRYNIFDKIRSNPVMELDDSDFALIRKIVNSPTEVSGILPLYAAQILIHMDNEKLKQTADAK